MCWSVAVMRLTFLLLPIKASASKNRTKIGEWVFTSWKIIQRERQARKSAVGFKEAGSEIGRSAKREERYGHHCFRFVPRDVGLVARLCHDGQSGLQRSTDQKHSSKAKHGHVQDSWVSNFDLHENRGDGDGRSGRDLRN